MLVPSTRDAILAQNAAIAAEDLQKLFTSNCHPDGVTLKAGRRGTPVTLALGQLKLPASFHLKAMLKNVSNI